MTKVAILQSNYIPWKGYFDLIASVDVFILYDDMQFTRRDWRNRNKIKTLNGPIWLSIPVKVKGKYFQRINEVEVSDDRWSGRHWNLISQNYKKAEFFSEVSDWVKPIYDGIESRKLSEINRLFIERICWYLNINTEIRDSREFDLTDGKTERLADLCAQVGANSYISGPSAKTYIDKSVFSDYGIDLVWADYSDYPPYRQLWGDFEHSVTILDLLFNIGGESHKYMKNISI